MTKADLILRLKTRECVSGLRNCHHIGLHSLVLQERPDGSLLRIFYTTPNHRMRELYEPGGHFTIGAHNHNKQLHFITLYGNVYNVELAVKMSEDNGQWKGYRYPFHQSALLEGGFSLGEPEAVSGELIWAPIHQKSLETSDVHTVVVHGDHGAWLVNEGPPQDTPKSIFSPRSDLNLCADGLYLPGVTAEMCDEILAHYQEKSA